MTNPYQAPNSVVADIYVGENTSGQGNSAPLPPGIAGWSWGAFLLNWIWAIGNSVCIGLLAIIPYVGFIFAIYIGIKGREMAWRKRRWESIEHFNQVQRSWSKWGVILTVGIMGLAMLAAIALPAYHEYTLRAAGQA